MKTKLVAALAVTCLLVAGSGAAFAAAPDQEATALQGVKVSLTKAIAIAERQTGGQAYDAGADIKSGRPKLPWKPTGLMACRP